MVTFYKQTRYKQTSIGDVPEEWDDLELKNIVEFNNGYSFKSSEFIEFGIPLLRISNIQRDGSISFGEDITVFLPKSYKNKYKNFLINYNDIVIAMSGATTGKIGLYKYNMPALLNQRVGLIKVKNSNLDDQLFVFYRLKFIENRFFEIANAMAQPNLSGSQIINIVIQRPPLLEQQKISEVLSKIDEAIEEGKKSIEKWQRIKKAAMRQLLTRGIGHKKFKYVEGIGEIPEGWGIKRLGDQEISKSIYYGITAKKVDDSTNLRMLRTTDIKDFNFDYDKLPYCEITDNKNSTEKYKLQTGDLIVARAGTVGVSVLVDKGYNDVVFGSYLIKVKLHKINVLPKYLHLFFQSDLYWKHLEGAQGSTLKNINLPLLKNLLVPLPPLSEQQKIAEILQKIDQVIETKQQKQKHLERVKREMMRLLLTGRVRIKI